MLNAVIPNLVDVAGKGFGFFLAVAVFGDQLVHVVQLLLIVVGNGDGFLIGVQNDTYDIIPPKKKMYESCRNYNLLYIVIYVYIYSSVF